ncbi:MAG: peptide chain release factor 1 [Candidatus Omnitrophica bacterium]|nr:peptide chain release factor 1 [Candidatus Omnitrophota bacterium]
MLDKLARLEKRYEELEQLLADHAVIADSERCNKLAKELSDLKDPVFLFRDYKKLSQESDDLEGMLKEKHDKELLEMAKTELPELKSRKEALLAKLKEVLKGEDKDAGKDVLVEIRQGTGGAEAAVFAADLYRMYTRYAERKGWKAEVMSSHSTDEGGFKEIVFEIRGRDAYRRLKFESGVHRVQRVPSTEAQGRIHTSTATVAVMIEPEDVELVINPNDLKIETYRASSAGGQHMQKTDSAVRITHIPTGTVVSCQDERSQGKNKSKAMKVLRTRVLDAKQQAEAKKIGDERRSQIGSGDRSEKIRTYNYPDRRVTDHRINFTSFQLESIMEGEFDEFTEALLKAAEEKAAQTEKLNSA